MQATGSFRHFGNNQYIPPENLTSEENVIQLYKNYQFSTMLRIQDELLEIFPQAKLLGTIISNDLKWNQNTDFIVKFQILLQV